MAKKEDTTKEILALLLNEKVIAMVLLTAIAFGGFYYLGAKASEVVMPIITGICSFVTGYVVGNAVKNRDNAKPEEET